MPFFVTGMAVLVHYLVENISNVVLFRSCDSDSQLHVQFLHMCWGGLSVAFISSLLLHSHCALQGRTATLKLLPFVFHSSTSLLSFNLFAFTPTTWSSIAACVQAITGYHQSYKPQDKYPFNYGWQLLPLNTMHLLESMYRFQNSVICQVFTDYESWTSIENHLYKEVQADLERQFETLIGSVANSNF